MGVPFLTSDPYLDANFTYLTAVSGVSAGTYGDSTHVGRITVDDRGRVTAASSVAIAGANTLSGTVATTDATPTTLATVPVATNTTAVITATVVARRTGGVSGTTGDGAGYSLWIVAKNIAGTVTIIAQGKTFSGEDQPAWDAGGVASSTNIVVQVTGAAANNISWSLSGQIGGSV